VFITCICKNLFTNRVDVRSVLICSEDVDWCHNIIMSNDFDHSLNSTCVWYKILLIIAMELVGNIFTHTNISFCNEHEAKLSLG